MRDNFLSNIIVYVTGGGDFGSTRASGRGSSFPEAAGVVGADEADLLPDGGGPGEPADELQDPTGLVEGGRVRLIPRNLQSGPVQEAQDFREGTVG